MKRRQFLGGLIGASAAAACPGSQPPNDDLKSEPVVITVGSKGMAEHLEGCMQETLKRVLDRAGQDLRESCRTPLTDTSQIEDEQ